MTRPIQPSPSKLLVVYEKTSTVPRLLRVKQVPLVVETE